MRLLAPLLVLLLAATAQAQAHLVIVNQGRLLDADDHGVNATVKLTFRIYALGQKPFGEDDVPLWFETYDVAVAGGVYAASLGLTEGGKKALPPDLFPTDEDRFMSVQVGAGAELTPRLRFGVVSVALSAAKARHADEAAHAAAADRATNADHATAAADASALDGHDSAYFADASHLSGLLGSAVSYQGTPLQNAQIGSAAAWDGKLDTVTVAAPLSGTGRSNGVLTLARAADGVDGYLSGADWSRFDAKLSTEADPKVGAQTTNAVPKWDGARLVAGSLSDVGGKVGIGVASPVAALDVGSSLRFGNDAAACDTAHAGALRLNAGVVEACDTNLTVAAWVRLNAKGRTKANAGFSCRTINEGGDSSGDGLYWIDPNGGSTSDAFQASCDMTTEGGGWTLVWRGVKAGAQDQLRLATGAVGTLTSPSQATNGKLADAVIDALETTWLRYGANARGTDHDTYLWVRARPAGAPRFSDRLTGRGGSTLFGNTGGWSPARGGAFETLSHLAYAGANECVGYWGTVPTGKPDSWGHYCAGWTSCNFWENSWPNTTAGNCTDGYIYAR